MATVDSISARQFPMATVPDINSPAPVTIDPGAGHPAIQAHPVETTPPGPLPRPIVTPRPPQPSQNQQDRNEQPERDQGKPSAPEGEAAPTEAGPIAGATGEAAAGTGEAVAAGAETGAGLADVFLLAAM
jgi:hypothetical protein